MDGEGLGPYKPVSDELILAAVERAARHGTPEVWSVVVAEHLGFKRTAHSTRRLRVDLERLASPAHELVVSREKNGRDYWGLTPTGQRWLARRQRQGLVDELPESPQHRQWRKAQEEAGRRMDDFRGLLYDAIEDAWTTAGAPTAPPSEVWFELAERLRAALWLVGSAIHCRDEWWRPDDARADYDENPGSAPGRRAVSAWDEMEVIAAGGAK